MLIAIVRGIQTDKTLFLKNKGIKARQNQDSGDEFTLGFAV